MRFGSTSSVQTAASLPLAGMSAFSLFGDMPGVYFDGGEGGSGGDNGGQEGKTFTQADIDALQAKLNDAEGKVKTFEDKNKTDAEKQSDDLKNAQTAKESAESQLKEARLQMAIERGARKLNIQDEDAAFKLLSREAVKYDDKGNPTNIDGLISDLVKAKPWLVDASGRGGSPSNPGRNRDGDRPTTLGGAIEKHYTKN